MHPSGVVLWVFGVGETKWACRTGSRRWHAEFPTKTEGPHTDARVFDSGANRGAQHALSAAQRAIADGLRHTNAAALASAPVGE